MTVSVPVACDVTTPVVDPMVATVLLLVLHRPVPVVSVSVVVLPRHRLKVP
jgi:hypothetical protein